MAPDWIACIEDREKGKHKVYRSMPSDIWTQESQMKLDIYALGIILADLICNPLTVMETVKIDDAIKAKKPVLPKGYKLEGLIEAELMLAMVQPEPKMRPTIDEIKNKWLVRWQESICSQD